MRGDRAALFLRPRPPPPALAVTCRVARGEL
jgi:hypothetical protein